MTTTQPHLVDPPTPRAVKPQPFEWYLGRLFYRQPGETAAQAWTVRVLSCALVLPVALTALIDLGRCLGFLIGKSWSLMKISRETASHETQTEENSPVVVTSSQGVQTNTPLLCSTTVQTAHAPVARHTEVQTELPAQSRETQERVKLWYYLKNISERADL